MENKDEIDLIELSREMMVRIYHYFLRRFVLLIIFGAVGVVLGGVYYLNVKSRYENKIKIISNSVSVVTLSNLINSLEDIRKSSIASFGNIMKIDSAKASKILSIKSDTLLRSNNRDKQIVEVTISYKEGFDNKNFANNLNNYIGSNKFVGKEMELQKKKSNILIAKYKNEIEKLKQLQNKILSANTLNKQSDKLLILDDKTIRFFHDDILSLESKIISEQEKLNFLDEGAFFVVDQNAGVKIKNISLIETLMQFFGIFIGLGFFITVILEFIRQVKYIEINQDKK